jgi:PST family polysaccharide transporter
MDDSPILERGSGDDVGRSIIRGSTLLILGRIGRTAVTILGMTVLARLLTPVDFGVLALATIPTVLSLVLLEAVIDYPIIRDDDLSSDRLRGLIWAGLLLNGVMAAMLLAIAHWLEAMLDFDRLGMALIGVIPVLLSQVYFVAGIGILRRQHRFAAASLISLFTVIAYIGVSVGLALAGYDLFAVIAGLVLSNIATAIILIMAARLPLAPPRRLATIIGQLKLGGYGLLSRLLNWGWTNVDTLAVSYMLGPFATGIYSRAYNISVQAKEPFLAIDQTMRQVFATAKSQSGGVGAQMIFALRIVTILSALAAAGIILLREWVVAILLGGQWTAVVLPLAILAAGLPARVARLYFDGVAVVVGDVRGMALRHGLLLAVIVAALLLFAQRGIAAVALCTVVPLYLSLPFAMGDKEREVAGPARRFLAAMLPGLAIGTAVVGIGELLLRPWLQSAPMLLAAADVALCATTLIGLAMMLPSAWLGDELARRRTTLLQRLARRLER